MKASPIIIQESIALGNYYDHAKESIINKLGYASELFCFDDERRILRYYTEDTLVPTSVQRIPVLILLSNPHPHSVEQGMFLSPNRIGRENPFWVTLRDTGYFKYEGSINADMMIDNTYSSPFSIFMSVLLPLPSNYPEELMEILGPVEYRKMLYTGINKIESLTNLYKIRNIICFGRLQYDAISRTSCPNSYVSLLKGGQLIKSKTSFADDVNSFLTFPTGWRFVKNVKELKRDSLKRIFDMVLESNKRINTTPKV